jgi:hypothetical protein
MYVKEEDRFLTSDHIHNYDTRSRPDYHQHVHNLELYDSKPTVAGCNFYNKLPIGIKQIRNSCSM